MDLSNLKAAEGSVHSDNFRRGRGHGSGNGKTAGKGHKGQKARSGAPRPGFEGGQMPLYRRLPKRGFKNRNTLTIVPINLSALERFDNDAVVSVETLIEAGIVKNPRDGVKILGNGELTKKLTVQANAFSASAKEKIGSSWWKSRGDLMLKTLRNAFKIKDVRNRILFTFMMLIVIRIGSELPIPGVKGSVFQSWLNSKSADGLGFVDAITGGSFSQMSVFALNITPYITSSIIMQLLTIAIPKLEEMQRDGEDGRKKIVEITRYLTIALGLLESVMMVIGFYRQNYLTEKTPLTVIMVVTSLTAGSAVLMWIGERITEKGVGNGISIVLTINIISRIPEDLSTLWSQFIASAANIPKAIVAGLIIVAIIAAMVVFVVLLQDAQRKIPVQYSSKIRGNKQMGGQQTCIPLKVNTSGVIPVIFAQSLMQTPVIIASFLGKGNGNGIGSKILKGLSQSNWCDPKEPVYSIGLIVYIVLIIAFAYFYTNITFNPLEIANNMKRSGGFIPGIRPGKPTSDYLNQILNYIVFIGAIGLAFIAFVPIFFNGVFNADVSFGGTSIIIIVGVVIETLKQIESQMRVRYYKGFLDD